jgi:hypothetical protein
MPDQGKPTELSPLSLARGRHKTEFRPLFFLSVSVGFFLPRARKGQWRQVVVSAVRPFGRAIVEPVRRLLRLPARLGEKPACSVTADLGSARDAHQRGSQSMASITLAAPVSRATEFSDTMVAARRLLTVFPNAEMTAPQQK